MAQRTWTASQESAMNIRDKMLLVSAAAGSGKTSVLTERIIRLLIAPDSQADLSRILVVTFTRAAAAELKSRIAAALTNALAERPGDTHLSKQLFLLGSAQISTIDAFFQKTVRDHFDQLNIPASFRLADQGEAYELCLRIFDDTVRDFYERYQTTEANTDTLFSKLSGNRFANIMDDLLSNRNDSEFDTKLLRFYEKFSSYPQGIELLKDYGRTLQDTAKGEFLESPPGKVLHQYLSDAVSYYQAQLERIGVYLAVDPDCNACFGGVHEYDTTFFSALKDALEKKQYEGVRKIVVGYQKSNFPTMRSKPSEMEYYKNIRTDIKNSVADWTQRFFAYSTEEIRTQMLRNAELCEILYQLFAEYKARVWEEKKRRGILEFNDVREQLYRLLTLPNGESSPVAESLSAQYDAVYIDEYQDVDFMQDRIFALIGKNRRFMVGDIKQSIYGFRGSEPSIFADYRKKMPLHTESQAEISDAVCVFMSDNFRCNQPIIDYANRVCSFLFSGCENSVGYRKEDDLKCSKTRSEESPAPIPVQTVLFEGYPRTKKANVDEVPSKRPNREAVWVASEIQRLLRQERLDSGEPILPTDIAILVRNANLGIPFVEELTKRGIPVEASTGDDIGHSPLMTDLLNLLRCIDNPHRDLPLSEYLLSRDGGFTLEELATVRNAFPDPKSLYDAISDAAKHEEFPVHKKCVDWVAWLEKFQKLASVQPADRFLRLLFADPRLTPHTGEAELLTFYEQARVYQRTSWCGLFGFLQHFEKLIECGSVTSGAFRKADSAVRVMTMHTSKGLEYPVVFICCCDKRFSTKSTDENLLFHRNLPASSRVFNQQTTDNESGILREISKLEIQGDEAEESIRLLYVALTRARERLYITGTPDGSHATLFDHADRIMRGSRYSILYHGNFLRWILAALREKTAENREMPCKIRTVSLSDELETSEDAVPIVSEPRESARTDSKIEPAVFDEYQSILEKHRRFVYPLEGLKGIPTKMAASKLRPDLLDLQYDADSEDDALTAQIDLMRSATPAFERIIDQGKAATATDIGTATHSFLEFCDLLSLSTTGIRAEVERLVREKFILSETAEILNLPQLEAFVQSDLMEFLTDAKEIFREQRFSLPVPLSALTQNEKASPLYRKQTVFVQGSIDLLLRMKDGKLVLFDYKTDYISSLERANRSLLVSNMTKKHGNQLSCYARAVRELFGKAPDETYIYSLPLGASIPIQTDDTLFDL